MKMTEARGCLISSTVSNERRMTGEMRTYALGDMTV